MARPYAYDHATLAPDDARALRALAHRAAVGEPSGDVADLVAILAHCLSRRGAAIGAAIGAESVVFEPLAGVPGCGVVAVVHGALRVRVCVNDAGSLQLRWRSTKRVRRER